MSPRSDAPLVALRKRDCTVCRELPPDVIAQVNAAIWEYPGVPVRARGYRPAAVTIVAGQGVTVEGRVITRHAVHIEESWHKVTPRRPAREGEIPVVASDYQTVIDRAASLGVNAMDAIEGRIPHMEDRDLVSVARLGVNASSQRETLRIRQQQADDAGILAAALFGAVSGTITQRDVPEAEIIDVTPTEELLDEVRQARAALKGLQRGEPAPA